MKSAALRLLRKPDIKGKTGRHQTQAGRTCQNREQTDAV